MNYISTPTNITVTEDRDNKNRATVIIEPCYPGYGITIGNALRRALLSSLPGAAVIAFKVKGVQHEFSTLAGVKEDIVELMMNLKQLRLKVASEEPVELLLSAKGEKPVTAGDIKKNADVEIINPDLVICNLTEKSAVLEMKIWVARGIGYVPTEEQKEVEPEVGVIQIDALYSPVERVGFKKENVRVGERTDYDKLMLDIETDGSLTPKEAVEQAAAILVEQFTFMASGEEIESIETVKENKEKANEEGRGIEKETKGKEEKIADESDVGVEDQVTKQDTGKKEEDKPKKKRGRPKKS